MESLLSNKVAIVTGSSSGIGEGIAVLFASRGAKVTLCGRDQERLRSVFEKVVKVSGGYQNRFLTVQGDLNDEKVRKEIIDQTIEKFGSLDILVANAGVGDVNQSLLTATEVTYNHIMDTNLKSVFFLIQQAAPHLINSKGNIVNISSVCTSIVVPDVAIYAISKAALDHLTCCLAVDLGAKGVRVNTVNPGYIPTRIYRSISVGLDKILSEVANIEQQNLALKERVGTVEDVAEMVAFLASDAAGFITGENIKVDGGRAFFGPHISKS